MQLCGGSEKAAKTPSMVKAMNVDGALTEGGRRSTDRGRSTDGERRKEH